MPDPNAQTPDLQAATGVPGMPEPMSQTGLVDALRSRGTLPQDLAGIMQAMAPLRQAPNPGLAIGSGMLNVLGGGNPAQNPYLAQQQAQQNAQMQQTIQLHQTQQLQLDREARRNEFAIRMLKDTIGSIPEGPQRDALSQQYEGMMARVSGSQFGGNLAAAIARRDISPEEVSGILTDAGSRMDPALIALRYPKVPPDKIRQILTIDPATIERITGEGDQERKRKAVEFQLKEADLFTKQHPELAKDPLLGRTILNAHRKLFGGQDYSAGSPESQDQAIRIGVLQQRADALAKLEEEERVKAQYRAKNVIVGETPLIFVNKGGNPADPLWTKEEAVKKGYFAITPKEYQTINTSQQALTILENMKTTTEEMKQKGLFVQSAGLKGLYEQAVIGGKRYLGDPAEAKRLLGTWDSQKAQMVILLRQLGDVGVRALGAFAPAMDALNTRMGAQSVESVLGQIESEFRSFGNKSRTPDAYSETPTVFKRPVPGAAGTTTPQDLYMELRRSGMSKEQAGEAMKARGYQFR